MKDDFERTYFSDRMADQAFQDSFAANIATAAKKAAGQYINPSNTHHLRHGGAWHNPANPDAPEGQMMTHSAETQVTITDLIEQRLEVLERAVNHVTKEMHDQFIRAFIGVMEEATTKSGNVINGIARPVSETFLEMLEHSHWSINAAGEIEPPMIMSGSEASARFKELFARPTPAFRQKADAIIERKIEEARQEEIARRARFSRYGDA